MEAVAEALVVKKKRKQKKVTREVPCCFSDDEEKEKKAKREALKKALGHLRRIALEDEPQDLEAVTVKPAVLDAVLRKAGVDYLTAGQLKALIIEAVNDGGPAPSKRKKEATFGQVRSCVWRYVSRLRQGPPTTWAAWSVAADRRLKLTKKRALRRLLAGENVEEAVELVKSHNIIDPATFLLCLDAEVDKWLQSEDGRFAALKLKAAAPVKKNFLRERRRRELLESEVRDGAVTLQLWRNYQADRQRQKTKVPWRGGKCVAEDVKAEAPQAFDDWLQRKLASVKKQEKAVHLWRHQKKALAKRVRLDRCRSAPAALLAERLEAVVSLCDEEVDLWTGALPTHRPSRKGLGFGALNRRLLHNDHRKKKDEVVTKGDFDDAFSKAAFSLLADKRSAKGAMPFADLATRNNLLRKQERKNRVDDDEYSLDDAHENKKNNVKDDLFIDDPQAARDEAQKLAADKRRRARSSFKSWLTDDRSRAKAGALKRKAEVTSLKGKVAAARLAARLALRAWKRSQHAVQRHEKKKPADDDDEEAREDHEALYSRLLEARKTKNLGALKACAELKRLRRDLKARQQLLEEGHQQPHNEPK